MIDNDLYPRLAPLALTFSLSSHKVPLFWHEQIVSFSIPVSFWSTLKMCLPENRNLCLHIGCALYILNCSSFSSYWSRWMCDQQIIVFPVIFLAYLNYSKHNIWDLLLNYFLSLYHFDKQIITRVGTEGSCSKFGLKINCSTLSWQTADMHHMCRTSCGTWYLDGNKNS